ncbi:MAG: hypothetical protein FJZ01_02090 [Candidatus Sericytochromatia bacterium]|nr:hypothetical protein [Candidatus Tanganyikabacteria bacterium]
MRNLIFARHFTLGALAAGVLLAVACASPRTSPQGMTPALGAAGPTSDLPAPGAAANRPARDPQDWGSVVFTVNWPVADRQLAYIHPDTTIIEIKAYDASGSVLKDANNIPIQGTLEKPQPPATSSTLALAEVPSGSVRFDAVAKNGLGTLLATGSATSSVQGNTTNALRLILGLPGEPKLYSFSPIRGFAGFTTVSLTGDNFQDGVLGGLPAGTLTKTAKLGNVTASANISSSRLLSFQVPAGAQDASISYSWTMAGITRTVTSTAAFTVISSVSILGTTTTTRGSTFSLTATGSSAGSGSFNLTASEANIMRIGSTCNPVCDGTGGQPSGSNGFTIIQTTNPGEFLASGSGTAIVQAGGGSVVATRTITIN